MSSRRGYALVELLVSMLLLLIVLGGVYRLLNSTQRLSRAQAERVDMQSSMRAGALIVPIELREIGYDTITVAALAAATGNTDSPDIQIADGDSIQFRAIRGNGVICAVSGSQITMSTAWLYSSLRAPVTTDSVLIFVDKDQTTTADDRWIARAITAATASSTACPTTWPTGRAGITFTVAATTAGTFNATVTLPQGSTSDVVASTDVTVGSPVKFFEVMRYSLYQSGGKNWLGAQSVSAGASRQPVLGPLAPSGFHLTYYDSTGTVLTPTTELLRSGIRTIRVSMLAVSDQNVASSDRGTAAQVTDSVVTTVALRNSITR